MAITPIVQVTEEGFVTALSSFMRGGEVFLAWALKSAIKETQILWKRHSAAYGVGVLGKAAAAFKDITTAAVPASDALVVAYTDSDVVSQTAGEPSLYIVRFAVETGDVLTAPQRLGYGVKPALVYRGGVAGDRLLLSYGSGKRGALYVRESDDGGVSWSDERPVLNNYVSFTKTLAVAAVDDEHLSVLQVGDSARKMLEVAAVTRTRPLVSIVRHPTMSARVLVAEPTWYDATYLTDYMRGALRLSRDGTKLYWLDGVRLGTSDSLNEVCQAEVTAQTVSIVSSFHNANADTGLSDNLVSFTFPDLASGPVADCFGYPSSVPVGIDFDVSNDYAYVAGTKEIAPTTNGGALDVVRLADMTSARVWGPSTTVLGRAVAVALPPSGTPVVFVGVNDGGQEKLRIYTESGMAPTFVTSHKMPARINKLFVTMSSASSGFVYVSMVDRLNVYRIEGLDQPIRLDTQIPILTNGSFHQVATVSNGNIVAAMGAGGVAVFSKNGAMLGQIPLTGIHPPLWAPGQVRALGDLVIPTSQSLYTSKRMCFKCTTAGTSSKAEPVWAPASYGTVADGSAVWTEFGSTDPCVTGVVVDEARARIVAVGIVGGAKGTQGRVYSIKAPVLVPSLPKTDTPRATPAGGSFSSPQSVTLTCRTPGASIYYTLDGSYPTENSTLYQNSGGLNYPIQLEAEGTTTIRAMAVAPGCAESEVLEVTYALAFPQIPTPTFSPSGYQAGAGVTVTISCAEAGVELRYTTDGSTPTQSSSLYSGPFYIAYTNGQVALKAAAFKYARHPSDVGSSFCYNTIVPTGLQVHVDPSQPGGVHADTSANNLVTGLKEFSPNWQVWYQTSPIPNYYTIGNWDGWARLGVGIGGRYPSTTGMYDASYTIQIAWKQTYVDSDRWLVGTEGSSQTQKCLYFGTRSGKLYLGHHNADITGGPNLSANTWYIAHAVYDRSAQTGSLYLNGNLVYGPVSQAPLLATDFLCVFRANATRGYANIAHLALYAKVLSASEIADNFGILRGRFGI